MMHDRVADEDRIENVGTVDLALGADLVDQLVERLAHGLGHALAAIGVHHHVGDPAHQVFAEADLRIGCARGGQRAARQKRRQMHGDGGRADVAGNPVGFVLETGIECHQCGRPAMERFVDCGGDLPVALAQDLLHLAVEIGVDGDVLEAPVGLDSLQQPVEIAERLVHVRLFDLDIAHLDCRVALDDAAIGILAHDLRIDHGVLRDIDDQVAEDFCRAGQPAAGLQVTLFGIAGFVAAEGRDVLVGRGDAVLGKDALLNLDLAAATYATPAADAFDMHAQLPRGFKHRRVGGKAAALARWHEQDEVVGGIGHWVTILQSRCGVLSCPSS